MKVQARNSLDRTINGIKSGPDTFDESTPMTFLTLFGFTKIYTVSDKF